MVFMVIVLEDDWFLNDLFRKLLVSFPKLFITHDNLLDYTLINRK